jgi:rSAM/selenodomain-associated transferase 2
VSYTFSIIIPVLHETETINVLLESLKKIESDEPFEIIVVDGSPVQDTLRVISDRNVKIYSSRQGRGCQMNEGAAHAKGDILIFLHADTFLPNNALSLIQTALEDERYAGGAFTLQIQSQISFLRMIAAYSTLRSKITHAPYGDQVIFLRKAYFDAIGGYADIPLMEDVELMRRIKKKKGQIVILPHPVITSDRRWHEEGPIYTLLRDNIIIFLYFCGMPAEKFAKFYPWPKQLTQKIEEEDTLTPQIDKKNY